MRTWRGRVCVPDHGWLGGEYELDLSAGNRERLQEFLVHYIATARHVGGTRPPRRTTSSAPSSNGDRTAEIRALAAENGHQVSDRGRIPKKVVEAFEAAH